MNYDVVVIGGGAAGLMCARVAAKRGRRVLVIEHANRIGKKILMSGGGRCNFTNLKCTPTNFLSCNPHFCISALARYSQWDFIAMVDHHGIEWHEKELGQLFCDDSSKQIVRMLMNECDDAGVTILVNCKVTSVAHEAGGFVVETSQVGTINTKSLVIATGGLSIPTMGATGFGYELARQYGHDIVHTQAALVPLTLSGRHLEKLQDLSGVALPAESLCNGWSFRAGLLFTHRGLSGPAILQISTYWQPGDLVQLNLLPEMDVFAHLQEQQKKRPSAELKTILSEVMPKRLAQRLCELNFESKPMQQYKILDLRNIAQVITRWPVVASGTEGYRTAEVTLGGVDTRELSSSTMESRRVKGLYFIGEVVDVTGQLGGHNFQWAWASGNAAGRAV